MGTDMNEHLAVCELKYRYLRFLDNKNWDALGALLTDDCVADYASGTHHHEGRASILAFLREGLPPTRLTVHQCHHPEITFAADGCTATGIWSLADVVIDTELGFTIRGASFYDDTYVRTDDGWRISHTGYERIYEEYEPRSPSIKMLQVKSFT
ncbi:MAG: nuclear transport factor 2 family protein [Acidimicrobiales bacterium]